MIEVLVISIANPILIGVYENKTLIETFTSEGKTSDILPSLMEQILKKYELATLFYVNSPGSYMSIKVSYVFLKTISITKNIPLKACDGFEFNENSPIKALGKKYFFKENGVVKVDFLDNDIKMSAFKLPNSIDDKLFSDETLPIYNLPAV